MYLLVPGFGEISRAEADLRGEQNYLNKQDRLAGTDSYG
jgi:hypothetical protein